jgi:hypothetical protein
MGYVVRREAGNNDNFTGGIGFALNQRDGKNYAGG